MFKTKMRAVQFRMAKRRGILFGILFVVILCVGTMIFTNYNKDYSMTEAEFSDYINRPIGSIMAELDYADDEKLVFHYLEGFFVIDMKTDAILQKINLDKLNIAGHTQGDAVTVFKIDKDGKFAYLTNSGNEELVKKYDNYRIDLTTGEVKVGKAPREAVFFTDYADTFSMGEDIYGWGSDRCIQDEDRTVYLTTQDFITASMQLITIHKDGNVEMRYVFGDDYVSLEQQKLNLIRARALKNDEEIFSNNDLKWEVSGDAVKAIFEKLAETRNLKYMEPKDGNYDVRIYSIWSNDTAEEHPMIFVFDNYKLELVFFENITQDEADYFMRSLKSPQMP